MERSKDYVTRHEYSLWKKSSRLHTMRTCLALCMKDNPAFFMACTSSSSNSHRVIQSTCPAGLRKASYTLMPLLGIQNCGLQHACLGQKGKHLVGFIAWQCCPRIDWDLECLGLRCINPWDNFMDQEIIKKHTPNNISRSMLSMRAWRTTALPLYFRFFRFEAKKIRNSVYAWEITEPPGFEAL